MTLSEFLLAQIAEDEDRARHARRIRPDLAQYRVSGPGPTPDTVYVDGEVCLASDVWERYERERPDARVLAECEAKRRIVADHMIGLSETLSGDVVTSRSEFCSRCAYGDDAWRWPCPTMVALALPYADHPDYDPAWR